jgi:hypothetical protein
MNLPRKLVDAPCAYPSLDRVPEEKRLRQYSSEFEGRDVWKEFYNKQIEGHGYSQSHKSRVQRCEEVWKEACQEHGRHHALATPAIVQSWCYDLLDGRTQGTVREHYLVYINRFYVYLMWNANYPHLYNPVQFAINDDSTVAEVWEARPHGGNE